MNNKVKVYEVWEIQPNGTEKCIACFKTKAAAERKVMLRHNATCMRVKKPAYEVREVFA